MGVIATDILLRDGWGGGGLEEEADGGEPENGVVARKLC